MYFSRIFNLMPCHGKRGLDAKLQFLLISHSVFAEVSLCPCFFNLCVFQVDTLSWKKEVSCKIPIFTNIIHVYNRKTFTFYHILVITEYVFTVQRAIHTIKGDNSKYIFFRIMPLFRLEKKLTFCNISVITKIYILNLEYVFTTQRAVHTIKGGNSKCIFSPQ